MVSASPPAVRGPSGNGNTGSYLRHVPGLPECAELRPLVTFSTVDITAEDGSLVLYDEAGVLCGSVEFYSSQPLACIEINMVSVAAEARGRGYATRLLRELERVFPGVPINHGGLSADGLLLNTSVYGPGSGSTLTPVRPGDDDEDDYEVYGIHGGAEIYRGGWTLDGERISDPHRKPLILGGI